MHALELFQNHFKCDLGYYKTFLTGILQIWKYNFFFDVELIEACFHNSNSNILFVGFFFKLLLVKDAEFTCHPAQNLSSS